MRFNYQYRTHENELRSDSLVAPSRDEAFAILKRRGVHPSRMELAPGVMNRLAAFGKRGWAIIILVFALMIALVMGTRLADDRQALAGDLDPDVMRHLESSGLKIEAINELLEARRRINDEYRRKIESEVASGELTPKAAKELLDAVGLGGQTN